MTLKCISNFSTLGGRDEQTFWNCFGFVLVLGFGIGFGIVYVIFGDLDLVLELSWQSLKIWFWNCLFSV